ncbi:MAG: cytochrome c class [Gemmatimonadetes bacterium]|nr:cytochrome c class [Gemmatimonadota bacterium]
MMFIRRIATTAALLVIVTSCEREDRRLNSQQPAAPTQMVPEVRLQPGPTLISDTTEGPYDDNAYGTTEGQVLFEQMNCSGCHANGGGGMGPPLMDDEWVYGSKPDQIFASIAEGRPNGMPTWKYRLNNQQIWQLVAYVRSLSGLTPKGARPSREDHMMVKPAPAQTPNAKPKNSGLPGSAQRP